MYFGVYEFPGAGRLPYSRLLQVTNYPPRGEYTQSDVERARKGLETYFHRIGYFRVQVTPRLEMHPKDGLVDVILQITLNSRAKFGDVTISGTTPEETQYLEGVLHSTMARLQLSAIRPGKTYSLKRLQNATKYLESRLNKQGHLAAQVKLIGAQYHPESNRADVTFNVQTGPIIHAKVVGAHLWPWTKHKLLPIYQQVGVDQEVIQEGRQNLVSQFQSKGFFDSKVDVQVEQQPGGELIVYTVAKGARHKVAGVDIAGNQHLADKQLRPGITVAKGQFFSHGKYSQKLVRASAKNLENIYKANGFSDVKVTPQVTSTNGNIQVMFRVSEGGQDIVDALRIEGNETLPESEIAPKGLTEIALM